MAWRVLGAGTHNAPEIHAAIKAEIAQDYRRELINKVSAAHEAGDDVTVAELNGPLTTEDGISVEVDNVSISTLLTHWSIDEDAMGGSTTV